MNVLVVQGGNKSERPFSQASAKDISETLREQIIETGVFDLRLGIRRLEAASSGYDVIFPVVHGYKGAGGPLQKELARIGKPFVGGDFRGFDRAWNKVTFKEYCDDRGIPTANWRCVETPEEIEEFGLPAVFKLARSEFSNQVRVVKALEDLTNLEGSGFFNSRAKKFVEEFVEGTEVFVGVINGEALPVAQVNVPKGKILDSQEKLRSLTSPANITPDTPTLSEKVKGRIREFASKIHSDLRLGSVSKIDFIVTHEEEPFALEVNTVMGLYRNGSVPRAAAAAGLEYPVFIKSILLAAIERN